MTWLTPSTARNLAAGVLAGLGLIGLAWWLTGLPGGGTDFYYTFRPLAQGWLQGTIQLYGAGSQGFYHPPWALWLITLFTLWPYRVGWALLTAASLAMMAAGAISFSQPGRGRAWALAFALFNLHTFDLLYRGQLAGTEVLGAAVGWAAYERRNAWWMGAAYVLLMVEPPNTIPAAIFLAFLSWRNWPRRAFWLSLGPPAAIVLASFAVFGWWPARWLANLSVMTVQPFFLTTIWRMAEQLVLPPIVPWAIAAAVIGVTVWGWQRSMQNERPQADLARLMLLISATLMITPYSLSYRMVLLVGVVMPYLSRWRVSVVLGLYLLTFLPLLRLVISRDNAWIDMAFVTAVFAATAIYTTRSSRSSLETVPVPTAEE